VLSDFRLLQRYQHFSDLTRCPTWVRDAHQSRHRSTTLNTTGDRQDQMRSSAAIAARRSGSAYIKPVLLVPRFQQPVSIAGRHDVGIGHKTHARADVSASRSHRSCNARVLAEIGHSQMQDRPANSATRMLKAGQMGPELGFKLRVAGMPPVHKGRPQQLQRMGERLQ